MGNGEARSHVWDGERVLGGRDADGELLARYTTEEGRAMAYGRHAARWLGENTRGSRRGPPFTSTHVLDRDSHAWRSWSRATFGR